jgi:hypothetical protein
VSDDIEPAFLCTSSVFDIHATVITREESREFDFDKLDSAVRATESYAAYGEPQDLFDLAAAYAFYIAKAHAFIAVSGHSKPASDGRNDPATIIGVSRHFSFNQAHCNSLLSGLFERKMPLCSKHLTQD